VVEAEVVEAAGGPGRAGDRVALVYVNQTTTSTRVEGPKIDQSRVRMQLRKSGDEWLVARVDAL
jgi:Mce-associated membrane protein